MIGRFLLRRVAAGIVVLFAITYVAFFTQGFAVRQRLLQPAPVGEVAVGAWHQTVDLWKGIPSGDFGTYDTRLGVMVRTSQGQPVLELVKTSLWNSSVLLLLSMALAGVVGSLLGIAFAAFKRKSVSLTMLLISILGVSTPSFFLAVLLQFGAVEFYKKTGVRLVPVGGFGWDAHMLLPVLVLAARPIAQVARLTSVHMENLIGQDFVRTARSKGLSERQVWFEHILPNTAGSVLTALATSIRFALSSLPVIEVFFGWPGLGRHLLEQLGAYQVQASAALVLATGFFFVVVDTLFDFVYRLLDPRLRQAEAVGSAQMETGNWLELGWSSFIRAITLKGLRERRQKQEEIQPLPVDAKVAEESRDEMSRLARSMRWGRMRAWRRATIGNPALGLGVVLGIGLLVVVFAGPQLAPHNPYYTHTRLEVAGEKVSPPLPPSDGYPLGTDRQGRDILSLLLVGARRTMMLALIAVAGRLIIGSALGFVAGWLHDSFIDRALMSVGEMVNSFPALLLATLVVYAVGIREGLYAFAFGLLVIGWPEVMQSIRAQVISVRPMAYIEGAVSTGAGQGQILTRHILPNLWPTIVSLAFLEMGGALMILGELGFLGVFIGGGFAAEGEVRPSATYYDIPEWGVMLANSWRSFRSYPWATLYPGLAFLVSIVTFTLLGEGLRRMAEELTLSMKSLFNRYTMLALVVVTGVALWTMESTGIWARFEPAANAFQAERALADATTLASPEFEGRQFGTPGADAAADWLAQQFADLGLVTAGEDWTYFQTIRTQTVVQSRPATLEVIGPSGQEMSLRLGLDYAERSGTLAREAEEIEAEIIFVALMGTEHTPTAAREALGITPSEAARPGKVLLLDAQDAWIAEPYQAAYYTSLGVVPVSAGAILVINDDPEAYLHRELPAVAARGPIGDSTPLFYITPDAAERILDASGYSLADLRRETRTLAAGRGLYLPLGARASVSTGAVTQQEVTYRNVMAMWPGEDVALDAEAVVFLANYDGLGTVGDILYPGANDNASGVATLLELVRSWKEWGFKPKRTILFIASGVGELHQPPAIGQYLSARSGMDTFDVIAVFQVEGVGAGDGDAPLMWRITSNRVSEMVQSAARQLDLPLTVKGAGLHASQYETFSLLTNYPMVTFSWPGADAAAHLPADTPETLDVNKLDRAGRILSLVTAVLVSDTAY